MKGKELRIYTIKQEQGGQHLIKKVLIEIRKALNEYHLKLSSEVSGTRRYPFLLENTMRIEFLHFTLQCFSTVKCLTPLCDR